MIDLEQILRKIKPYVLGWVRQVNTQDNVQINSMVDYAVAWTAATANPAIGNGVLRGRYTLRGRMCLVNIYLIIGSTTTLGTGDWRFSLPFTVKNGVVYTYIGNAHLRDSGANNYERFVFANPGGVDLRTFVQLDNATNVNVLNATTPWAWGSGDSMNLQIEYEVN